MEKKLYKERPDQCLNDVIMIDDSDVDILSNEGIKNQMKTNAIWRDIIECDLLDERIKCIVLENSMVHRDTESYELPSDRLRKTKRIKSNQKNIKKRLESRKSRQFVNTLLRQGKGSRSENIHSNDQLICLSSDDAVEIIEIEQINRILCKNEASKATILNDSETDSSSENDGQENNKLKTWSKLIEHLRNNKFQIEFGEDRNRIVMSIARELQESKIDLIDRSLIYLGVEKCIEFMEATKKIESCGGMTTKDGSRKRTPGGIFLMMIKSDPTIGDVIKEQIFLDTDNQFEENTSLWWKSLETFQYKRSAQFRGVANYARKKEFNSYTFLDLDYFESIRDFRYRYIPTIRNLSQGDLQNDVVDITDEGDDDDIDIITQFL